MGERGLKLVRLQILVLGSILRFAPQQSMKMKVIKERRVVMESPLKREEKRKRESIITRMHEKRNRRKEQEDKEEIQRPTNVQMEKKKEDREGSDSRLLGVGDTSPRDFVDESGE
ncbi:hypothetical protein Tco_0206582 [Tanacetum coccineum]